MSEESFAQLHPIVQHHVISTLAWPDLRPLQAAAVQPVLADADALLLAPTAGGKTEAAMFPLLTRMANEDWQGTSVLYLCPLRALLNNLQPRLDCYARWLGRSAELWHGDVSQSRREQIKRAEPDILMTTPESLESMLVSTKVDARRFFRSLRAVVVDEVHAFAGDDRGWHMLAVLERLSRLAGQPLQRIGLSATVGNPAQLLAWLQGSENRRTAQVVAPAAENAEVDIDIALDHVGTIDNAAKVISALHGGEKRLVFVDSRRRAEELGSALRALGVTTFLSHSSLSAAERRRSEEAFSEAKDCVIVATSTLELGIDVGDLDRVIQIDAPRTVASFLQRLGRTGRRSGTARNCLFLCLDEKSVLHAAALLHRWAQGWVEPICPPVSPRHIVAQQLLALALQEHTIGPKSWRTWWGDLALFDSDSDIILRHLIDEGYFVLDGELAFIGPEAERKFGRRYFSDLTAVFSAPPQFTVLAGREEIGTVTDDVLITEIKGPRVLLLGGRSWLVIHIDWTGRRCFVESSELPGQARWGGFGGGLSFDISQGMRDVLLGAELDRVALTARASRALADLRDQHSTHVRQDQSVVTIRNGTPYWWTWAGTAANRTLYASLGKAGDPHQRIGDQGLRLASDMSPAEISDAISSIEYSDLQLPTVNSNALSGLKFSVAIPKSMATDTVARRLADRAGAIRALEARRIFNIE